MYAEPTLEYARELLSYVPARPQYDEWLKIISAVSNTFDEGTALRLLTSKFGDEKPNETERKIKNRLSNISFATLVYYAKRYGYKPDLQHHNRSYKSNAHGTNG
jgi:hypothetical protein